MSRGLASWWTSPPPAVGLEFSSRAVAAVGLRPSSGRGPSLAGPAVVALPGGALVPALNAANLADRQAVTEAVREVLGVLGRPRRVAVALPDVVARLALARLEKVPARQQDRDQLLRFQLRKSVPFPLESAQTSVAEGRTLDDGSREFVVALARRDIIEEYEAVCSAAGAHAGVVDLSTSGILHLVLASEAGSDPDADRLVVHLTADCTSIVIMRGRTPIFFRTRAADSEEAVGDVVHQAAMYYEDRLAGRGFARVLVIGADAADRGALGAIVGDRLAQAVEVIDPASLGVTLGLPGGAALSTSAVAGALGLVLREGAA